MPAAATAASALVCTQVRHALQHVVAMGACSAYRLARGSVLTVTRSSILEEYSYSARPLARSSARALSVFSSSSSPIPRRTFSAFVNWISR
jgi:hypothetical protein